MFFASEKSLYIGLLVENNHILFLIRSGNMKRLMFISRTGYYNWLREN
jgi:hypothetical protein